MPVGPASPAPPVRAGYGVCFRMYRPKFRSLTSSSSPCGTTLQTLTAGAPDGAPAPVQKPISRGDDGLEMSSTRTPLLYQDAYSVLPRTSGLWTLQVPCVATASLLVLAVAKVESWRGLAWLAMSKKRR
jgi:hypothetical protein